MEEQRLTEALQASGLPERQQLILALAPGCLFGFPPPNLGGIIERVDCLTCRSMMEIVHEISSLLTELRRRMDDHRRPVRGRNDARRVQYDRRRRVFIIGRLARLEQPEEEPTCRDQPWYTEAMERARTLETSLVQLSAKDSPHWGADEQRDLSREVIGMFLKKDHHYTLRL